MTVFTIAPANSIYRVGVPAFRRDSAAADSLTVKAGAFLVSDGDGGIISSGDSVLLAKTGAWTVQVDGSIVSEAKRGLVLGAGNLSTSQITVGMDGSIGGFLTGIEAASAAIIVNRGTIFASDGQQGTAIAIRGAGAHSITNSGLIKGERNAINDVGGASNDTVDNSGVIDGSIFLGGGTNRLTNSGTVLGPGNLSYAGGNGVDTVVNYTGAGASLVSGRFAGDVDLGRGNDIFKGGANAENVRDGGGSDRINLGGGDDVYYAASSEGGDGADMVNGGIGTDTYQGLIQVGGTGRLVINLDTAAHSLGAGEDAMAANTAKGADVSGNFTDRVFNFENVIGTAVGDTIYGSAAANFLQGIGGIDRMFGFGGNDVLDGGDGDDVLTGGGGRDTLTGDANTDLFVYNAVSDSGITAATRDVITDFVHGVDAIYLTNIDANTANGGATNETFSGVIAVNAPFAVNTPGRLRTYLTATGLIVEGNTDNDTAPEFSVELMDPSHSLVLSFLDFVL